MVGGHEGSVHCMSTINFFLNRPEAAEDASLSQDTDEPASLEDSHPHPWETNKHDPDSSSHSVSSAYAQVSLIISK